MASDFDMMTQVAHRVGGYPLTPRPPGGYTAAPQRGHFGIWASVSAKKLKLGIKLMYMNSN